MHDGNLGLPAPTRYNRSRKLSRVAAARMDIVVEPDRRAWENAAAAAAFWPLQQDWDYGLAVRWQRRPVLRLLAREGAAPLGALQLVGRRWLGLAELWLALRGPVLLGGAGVAARDALLAHLPKGLLRACLLAPELAESQATDAHWAGRTRIYTGHSCALVDLAGGDARVLRARLHQKWRNRLVRAEAAGLRVETASGGKWLDWLLDRYAALRAERRFAGPSRDFAARIAELKAPRASLVVVALAKNEPVAGALFLRHGPDASYYVAASTPEGKRANAANLVLWRAMEALQAAGTRTLDLGTIDTDRSPGLARFKLGAGAVPLTLAGTYL
jgi:hypothetical protein